MFEFLNLLGRFGRAEGELAQTLLSDKHLLSRLADIGSDGSALWRSNDGFIACT
ncbi:hypothetical protein [Pseudomonas sp. NCCP-436]|uniref:hypothetical protein n=1 Tax=Pseudomonas sp. NCCP-436 TaxID=2842481 RepID=UPI001C7F1BA6|nr:hypothetical protein [Pseudomonas sp. NCCP-436]GIZ12680.1 hypothetical protein NCCP436_20960 [Pseudomonas sp. NCCP-436]